MSPGVVSVSNFESELTLHAKRGIVKLAFSTIFLEKRVFLQMNPNIDILYTVENHFLPWLIIRDRYLKLWFRLVRIDCQSSANLHRKACQQIRPLSSWMETTIVMNTMAPKITVKNDCWLVSELPHHHGSSRTLSTTNDSVSQQNGLAPAPSACSGLQRPARACRQCSIA